MKLTPKFALIFMLISALSIGLVGYLAYSSSRTLIKQDMYSELNTLNDHKEAALDRWIDNNVRSLEILAQSPYFRKSFPSELHDHGTIMDPAHIKAHKQITQDHLSPVVRDGRFIELFILNAKNGIVMLSTNPVQEGKYFENQPFFREGKKNTYVQNVYYSMTLRQPAMTVSTPVKDRKNETVAVLAGRLNLFDLSEIMEKGIGTKKTLDTYLVNKFNFFITEPRFGNDFALKKSIHTRGVTAALSHQSGVDLYMDYRHVPVIGAYRWLPDHELCLVTEIDQKEAFAPVTSLQKTVGAVGVIAAVLAAIAGWVSALTVTRPLNRLIHDTEVIGTGNLDYDFKTQRKDEVGDLSDSFARMTRQLKESLVSRDELAKEIEDRKKAQSALAESEVRFRTLAESSPLGIFSIRLPEFVFSYVNPAISRIFGYPEKELIDQRGPMDLTHPDDHGAVMAYVEALRAGKTPGPLTFRGLLQNGEERLCEVTVRMVTLGGGQMIIGTLSDITERARAQAQIQREKQFSDTLINSLPGVFYLFEKETLRFHRWNQNFETVTGYASSEIAGMSPLDLFDETDRPRVAQRIGEVFEKGISNVEANFFTKDGRHVPFFFTGIKLTIGEVDYLAGTGIDISQRKDAENALRESEDRFRRLAENAKDMIYRMSLPDGRYEYVSPASRELFGYPPEVFYENPLLIQNAIHPDWHGYFQEKWAKLLEGEAPPSYEYQIIDASGNTRWFNQRNVLLKDGAGNPVAIEGIVTDVTELRLLAQEQIQLEKLSVLGRVAAGVAHELNNPLMGVLNYVQYCIEQTDRKDDRFSILTDMEHETRRCIGIVQNLLGASRMDHVGTHGHSEFSPQDIINRVIRLMEYRTGKEDVHFRLHMENGIPNITMNPDAFQQLCINLFTNALDAVESSEKKEVSLNVKKNTDQLMLEFTDTGCGIPLELQNKIFDPFFTTKPPGKGTGLGLATCWKIVHDHGGTLACDTVSDAGTTMTVVLPIHPKKDTQQ